jgi:two-component system, NtrC family, sensor kinase
VSEYKAQLARALLVVLTMAAVIAAIINFQQQKKFPLADDGVSWVDRPAPAGVAGAAASSSPDAPTAVEALYVDEGSPADRAGIRPGDILLHIQNQRVSSALDVTQFLVGMGPWKQVDYGIFRQGVEFKTKVVVGQRAVAEAVFWQYAVGAAYLIIGLFVYFRRVSAPKSLHFYILCLASFVLHCFHYTGKLNNFDWMVYWGNVAAGLIAPTLFLHFALTFPETGGWLRKRWVQAMLYVPAGAFLAVWFLVASGRLRSSLDLGETRWLLDRLWLPFLAFTYLAGAFVLAWQHRREQDPICRAQLRWLRNGAFLGLVPFIACYVIPYTMGAVPSYAMQLSVLALGVVPLTWAYAILRYRLMDVDIIFQQGYVYTLATLSVIGLFYGLLFALGSWENANPAALVVLMLIATFVFQPIRNYFQELLDRYYYRQRYDYRRTLIEFGRELSSETNLDHMLESVADRLVRTLSIQHVAFFLRPHEGEVAVLHMAVDRYGHREVPRGMLDLGFLDPATDKHLFFERTRHALDVVSREAPPTVRQTIAELDLTYYLPCRVRGVTVGWLGVSRTDKGDFLSSEDIELLATLAGYVGIAVENARLYHSLERKVEQYERLKEFSENIVESINVGIVAAGLDQRVESWNSQMERITGVTRDDAVGCRLDALFPADLCDKLAEQAGQGGVHNIYKFVLRRLRAAESNGHGNSGMAPAIRETILNIAVAPLVSKDQEQIGRLIIMDDVTDRADLERRLVQADKLSSIGLLAAGVAHEVNTPLAVISTYAQMLAKQVSDDSTKTRLLDKIAKQTFRASEIVNSLLNFSRTSPTEFVDIDMNKVIRETLTLVEHQLREAAVRVAVPLMEGLPPVQGNAGKLQQVFLNLFLNARDAMSQHGGTLEVRTLAATDTVIVEVSDTGQGIAPENLQRIFDPFFTTKAARKGTGLGLAVTYGIVQEHQGSIEVASRIGAGTRFHLEFPMAATRRRKAAPRDEAADTASPVAAG